MSSTMAEPEYLTEVQCQQTDCLFYRLGAKQQGFVICTNKDKPHYMNATPCPIYRLDWQKKAADSQKILKMFNKR